MAKIIVNNPRQVINGGAKKYYFKVKGLGGPKGDKGDKGDTGSQGPQGPQGNAATVSIGSTTTLPVGYDATVTNSGSIYNAVLNFGIPQGPRGPQGATGATGAKGDKGDQGNPGPQGEKGTNATVYVGTTSTLNPGSQATVYNSGTDSNAVLNFGIPKGEKGDTGPMPTIAQTTGQAIDQVMSQKATTDALNTKQATITSSNKLSADLVDDTSTTNKFVTASDITNWNAKQDALTAGNGLNLNGTEFSADTDVLATKEDLEDYYTKPETDNLLAPKLEAEVVAELPTTGAEGKLYLTPKAHTTSTATGNPITATITDEAGAIESFQLYGDTFQQSYTGKNLLKYPYWNTTTTTNGVTFTDNGDGSVTANGTASSQALFWVTSDYWCYAPESLVVPAGTYTIKSTGYSELRTIVTAYGKTQGLIATWQVGSEDASFTLDEEASLTVRLSVQSGATADNYTFRPQIEVGSTSSSYEPYVGGQASPNPDYPQPIQTVTGLQTISINGTDYLIDLGSIELCKLGTYQDYIWKDGEDWKVHKAMDKHIFDGSESFSLDDTYEGIYQFRWSDTSVIRTADQNTTFVLSDRFRGVAFNASWTKDFVVTVMSNRDNPLRFMTSLSSTTEAFKTWLASNQTTTYFVLKTPTDTVITDTTLIAQLEAIRTASLANGTNTITNTATGTNLAGDMEIGYYGYNPISRYDEYVWLIENNSYEQLNDTTNYALVQEVVDSLPSTGDSAKLYLVPREYTGKNLLPPSLSRSMGYLDAQGNIYASNPKNEATFDFLKVKPNTTYTFSIAYTTDTVNANYWFGIGAYTTASTTGFISMPYRADTGSNNFATFTTPSNTNYIRISGRYMEHAVCQLEQGYQATDYEPYKQTALNEAYDKWLWIDGAWERMDESKTIEALARNQVDGNLRDLMNFEVGDISAVTGENIDGGEYQDKLLRNDRIYKFNFSLYIPASEVTKTTLYTYTDEGEFIREIFPFTNNTKGWFIPANTSFRIRLDYNTIPDGGRPTITDPKTSPIYQNFSIVPFEDYKANTLAKLQSEGNVIDPSNLKYSLRLAIADINNAGIDYTASADRRMATYDILHFDHDIVLPKQSKFYFYLWTYTDQSGAGASGQGWKYLTDSEYVIPAGTYFRLLFVIDRASTTPLYDIYDNDIFKAIEIYKKVEQATTIQYNPNMRSVAHQGYSTTSQTYGNSRLSSYIGAKKHGFDFGECDIQFSSDGVPVCCHDASFSSNGTTVVIADHTLAELKTYNYYGETIASLDEVVRLCKELGLGLYIDHLNGSWSDAYWNTIFALINKYQMQDNVYWLQGISRSVSERILSWYSRAKIVLVISASDLTSAITEANAIKTDLNEVSIDFNYTQVTVAQMQSYAAQLKTGVQLEIWTVDNATDYKSYLPYARGITSNKICYNDVYEDL